MSKHNFPRTLWQVWFTTPDGPDLATIMMENKHMIRTWTEPNPQWAHIMIDEKYANDFIARHFNAHPQIQQSFDKIQIPVLKADLLRLLVLYVYGGLYNDLDVECMRPIESWGLESLSDKVELVVGLEYDNFDKLDRPGWPDDVQIATWTILARANSNLLLKIALTMTEHLSRTMEDYLKARQPFALGDDGILDVTGPRGFTRALLEILSNEQGSRIAHAQLSMLDAPKILGGVCFLPVTAFACEQPHSRSGRWNDPTVLVMHHYHHSWKKSAAQASCLYSRCMEEKLEIL